MKSKIFWLGSVLAIVILLLSSGCSSPSGDLESPDNGDATLKAVSDLEAGGMLEEHVKIDEVLLKLRDEADAGSVLADHNLTEKRYWEQIGYHYCSLAEGARLLDVLEALKSDERVLVAEPNYIYRKNALELTPNDWTLDQWGLDVIRAREGWVAYPGDQVNIANPSDVLVAVLDTGIDYYHDDLNPAPGNIPNWLNISNTDKFAEGVDLVNGDSEPTDDNGHGTWVSSIIGALTNNGFGIAGTSMHARLMAVKVLDENGEGSVASSVEGILYAVQKYNYLKNYQGGFFNSAFRARLVINMSYGNAVLNSFGPPKAESDALDYAIDDFNAICIAAAGDHGRPVDRIDVTNEFGVVIGEGAWYPAAHQRTIAVGAIDQDYVLLDTSNTPGTSVLSQTLDKQRFVVAPGKDIIGAIPGDDFAVFSGTSASCAFTSGAVAILLSYQPYLREDEIVAKLMESANADVVGIAGIDYDTGHGLIDMAAMVNIGDDPPPDPINQPMMIRAFGNPILQGDIMFIVHSKVRLRAIRLDSEFVNNQNVGLPTINGADGGIGISVMIDNDPSDGLDDPAAPVNDLSDHATFAMLDEDTFAGRIHLPPNDNQAGGNFPNRPLVDGGPIGRIYLMVVGYPHDGTVAPFVEAQTYFDVYDFNFPAY